MSPRRSTTPTIITPPSRPEPIADVVAMIIKLTEHRKRARDKAQRSAYQAAIDRLSALVYWLRQAELAKIPASPPSQPPLPAPPASAAMPAAAPRPAIVIAQPPTRLR